SAGEQGSSSPQAGGTRRALPSPSALALPPPSRCLAWEKEAVLAEDGAGLMLLNVRVEALGDRSSGFQEHHALPERRVPILRNQHVGARCGHAGNECNRMGDDAALRVGRCRKLGSLSDILAVDQLRPDLVP